VQFILIYSKLNSGFAFNVRWTALFLPLYTSIGFPGIICFTNLLSLVVLRGKKERKKNYEQDEMPFILEKNHGHDMKRAKIKIIKASNKTFQAWGLMFSICFNAQVLICALNQDNIIKNWPNIALYSPLLTLSIASCLYRLYICLI
jgi:hypothetical protein